MLDVWETLARTLRRAGRSREALEALTQVDRLSPGTPQILLALSNLSLENRDFRKARLYVDAARIAGSTNFHGQLAAIALAEGNLEMARTEALTALSQRKTSRQPRVLLARIEQQKGKLVEALAYLDQALEVERKGGQKPLVNLRSTQGDILARMGRESVTPDAGPVGLLCRKEAGQRSSGPSRRSRRETAGRRGRVPRPGLVASRHLGDRDRRR